MDRDRRGNVLDSPTCKPQAETEIHVFKPNRMKTLVQTGDLFPARAAEGEKCARGLVHIGRLSRVQIYVTVAPVYGIGRPQAIHSQHLKREGGGSGETAHLKSPLRRSAWLDQAAAGRGHSR